MELKCYQVGECDWFAAESPEQALALMHEIQGDNDDYEVVLVNEPMLDMNWHDEDPPHAVCGTLRQWLAEASEPGWLVGTEG